MPKINSMWFAIEQGQSSEEQFHLENQNSKAKSVKITCMFFGTMIIKTLAADPIE